LPLPEIGSDRPVPSPRRLIDYAGSSVEDEEHHVQLDEMLSPHVPTSARRLWDCASSRSLGCQPRSEEFFESRRTNIPKFHVVVGLNLCNSVRIADQGTTNRNEIELIPLIAEDQPT
jgi:hypothetical protein